MTMTAKDKALINASTARGGKVQLPEGPLLRTMKADGLVGANGGLTRAGSIAAMKAKRAAEDEMFDA